MSNLNFKYEIKNLGASNNENRENPYRENNFVSILFQFPLLTFKKKISITSNFPKISSHPIFTTR